MSEQPSKRVVLSPEVTRDDVETAAYVLRFLINNRIEHRDDQPREDIWESRDGSTWLHEIEDHITGLRYLVIRGTDVDKTVRRLRKLLSTVTHTDALHALKDANNRDDKLLALYQLGAAAPEKANSRVVAAFKRALKDPDPDLRYAALVAIAYSGWPEMKEVVHRTMEEDPSETVRDAAGRLLASYP